jgi:L-glyceraldehyde 3-phosphate reductase
VVGEEGMGSIVFSPLAQGRLTDKYINGVPTNSRIGRSLPNGAIQTKDLSEDMIDKIKQLNTLALERGQTLAQMAIAWLLRDPRVTSVLVGASSIGQLQNSIDALNAPAFSAAELQKIEFILSQ